jgi:hypothetical protein
MNDTALDLTYQMMEADPWAWAEYSQIVLPDGIFGIEGRPYQIEILQSEVQRICIRKATQGGGTLLEVIRSLHKMIKNVYPKGILYLFPTADDVTDFSSSRFKPLINDNPQVIGRYVRDTNRDNLKRIGSGFLYFRGAKLATPVRGHQKTSAKLKSIPVDRVIFDEFDEMDAGAQGLAKSRMADSQFQEEAYLANPTMNDYGIDYQYETNSDRRVWMIKCQACNKEACLELEFPNSLKRRTDGSVYLACIKCGREVFVNDGRWAVRNPERSTYMQGYWISQLIQPNTNLTDFLNEYEQMPFAQNVQKAITNFYNLRMGMAHTPAENRLTVNDVYRACGNDPMMNSHIGPCAAGIDVGKTLHVVIGYRPADYGLRIVKVARVSSFNDVYDLCKRFHVSAAVFDLYPETRKVTDFREASGFEVFGCEYGELKSKKTVNEVPDFVSATGIVKVNRTDVCDASHDLIKQSGRVELPRIDDEMERYAEEMSNMAKLLHEEDDPDKGGFRQYIYRKLGPDHYRHATNYFLLAAMRIGVCDPEYEQNKPKDGWADAFEDAGESGGFMGA